MDWIYLVIGLIWAFGALVWLSVATNTERSEHFALAALYSVVSLLNLAVSVMYHVNP